MGYDVVTFFPSTGLDKPGASVGLPLALLHAVSLVDKAGYRVRIIDQRVDKEWRETLRKSIGRNTLCLGVSSMTGTQIKGALEASRLFKKHSKAPVVWGGIHPSLAPRQTLKNKHIDIAVIGEGEAVFLELVNALRDNGDLSSIKGIGFKNRGEPQLTEARDFEEIEAMPELPYHLVNVENYFLNLYQSKKTLSLLSGKGCPHQCAYCYNHIFNKSIWRGISPERLLARVKKLASFGAKTIDLVDDNFFVNPKRVEEFCRLMIKADLKVKFLTNARADFLARADLKYIRMLYKAGFRELFIGVESGSNRVLKLIKKNTTVKQALKANRRLKQTGIKPVYSFMAGFPGETLEDVNKTIRLMIRLADENPEASLTSLKVFTPYPGTELYNTCIKHGFKPPESLEGWSEFDYNSSMRHGWKSKAYNALLENLSYTTYFLDKRTMQSHLGDNAVLRMFISAYSSIVRLRCKHSFYSFTPEISLMKYLKKRMFR